MWLPLKFTILCGWMRTMPSEHTFINWSCKYKLMKYKRDVKSRRKTKINYYKFIFCLLCVLALYFFITQLLEGSVSVNKIKNIIMPAARLKYLNNKKYYVNSNHRTFSSFKLSIFFLFCPFKIMNLCKQPFC